MSASLGRRCVTEHRRGHKERLSNGRSRLARADVRVRDEVRRLQLGEGGVPHRAPLRPVPQLLGAGSGLGLGLLRTGGPNPRVPLAIGDRNLGLHRQACSRRTEGLHRWSVSGGEARSISRVARSGRSANRCGLGARTALLDLGGEGRGRAGSQSSTVLHCACSILQASLLLLALWCDLADRPAGGLRRWLRIRNLCLAGGRGRRTCRRALHSRVVRAIAGRQPFGAGHRTRLHLSLGVRLERVGHRFARGRRLLTARACRCGSRPLLAHTIGAVCHRGLGGRCGDLGLIGTGEIGRPFLSGERWNGCGDLHRPTQIRGSQPCIVDDLRALRGSQPLTRGIRAVRRSGEGRSAVRSGLPSRLARRGFRRTQHCDLDSVGSVRPLGLCLRHLCVRRPGCPHGGAIRTGPSRCLYGGANLGIRGRRGAIGPLARSRCGRVSLLGCPNWRLGGGGHLSGRPRRRRGGLVREGLCWSLGPDPRAPAGAGSVLATDSLRSGALNLVQEWIG